MRVVTAKGTFGRTLRFPDGLTVLRAQNSAGKSSSIQAAIYALGLEGMLSASRGVPLPHAFTDYIEHDGERLPVISSEVFAEIENKIGARVTVQRAVAGERDTRLITVWRGSLLGTHAGSDAPSTPGENFYARDPGAATSAVGFHTMLLEFIGWDLPSVPRFSGGETRLYPETIFPLIYVEQKKGWGAIEGRFPTHFGIRDVARRATEFLLGLEVSAATARRAVLREQQQVLRQRWTLAAREIEATGRVAGVLIRDVSSTPVPDWPPAVPPSLWLARGETWVTIEDELSGLAERLAALTNEVVPTTGDALEGSREALRSDEAALATIERAARETAAALEAERGQVMAIGDRLRVLDEDLIRNKDARKLQSLGAVESLSVTAGRCPTCHQDVSVALLEHTHVQSTMSVDDNIRFLEEQRKVFELTLRQVTQAVAARGRQVSALSSDAAELRSRIRALRATLTADTRGPSLAAVEERVRLSHRVRNLTDVRLQIRERLDGFVTLAEAWAEVTSALRALPTDGLSKADEEKLVALETSLSNQLQAYALRSVEPARITISRESYRPEYVGFDLQFDLSASDTIRTIWAYRLALLEVARAFPTNHLGLVIFDEPRQQSTEPEGFQAFLARASAATNAAQQVIVVTSEEAPLVDAQLAHIAHTRIEIPERLLVLGEV
jgi:hypothetical protein